MNEIGYSTIIYYTGFQNWYFLPSLKINWYYWMPEFSDAMHKCINRLPSGIKMSDNKEDSETVSFVRKKKSNKNTKFIVSNRYTLSTD